MPMFIIIAQTPVCKECSSPETFETSGGYCPTCKVYYREDGTCNCD